MPDQLAHVGECGKRHHVGDQQRAGKAAGIVETQIGTPNALHNLRRQIKVAMFGVESLFALPPANEELFHSMIGELLQLLL